MARASEVLIVGAGPTGLAAALFLAERGHRARVVEQATEPSPYSKAFGVNARSLKLLESTGVTDRFLANGGRMRHLTLHRHGKALARLHVDGVDANYPFLCVQSQAESERLLAEAVLARGVTIERGVRATGVAIRDGRAHVQLEGPDGQEVADAGTVLAADGSSSTLRKALGIRFDGKAYPEPWRLWDVELEVPLDPDQGHIFLLDRGGIGPARRERLAGSRLGAGSAGIASQG
jgi:2-polyprenyl-6-methoxyphenol hydroxylase-like FAD-dependent oxidoreductase